METRNLLFCSISTPVHEYVSWLISQLQLSTKSLSIVLPGLTTIITSPAVKTIFGKHGGVGYICHHLRVQRSIPPRNKNQIFLPPTDENLGDTSGQMAHDNIRSIQLIQIRTNENGQVTPTTQQQYELIYCLWVMSLDVKISCIARLYFKREGAVPVLAHLIAVSPREKVIRLSLSILKNLAQCNENGCETTVTSLYYPSKNLNTLNFLSVMIGCGILKSIQFMSSRTWNDQEMQTGT
jgi:V-ATPase subunit H